MEIEIVNTARLRELETVISNGRRTFIEVGKALQEIRDSRLYLDSHDTFEDYCRVKWDMSRVHAHRLIESTEVVHNLLPIGNIQPATESQTRPLARLSPEQQREAWQKAVETAPEGRITARHISKVVSDVIEINIADHGDKTTTRIKKIQKEDLVEENLKKAYEAFYWQVQNAKLEKWANTSKMACLQMVRWITDLIEI